MPVETIKDIFVKCQEGQQAHPKLIKALNSLYEQSQQDSFIKQFCQLLRSPLVVSERAAAVERTLNFVAKFAASFESATDQDDAQTVDDDETNPFVVGLFKFLIKIHDVENQTVRFRVCQLINKLLNGMTENAQIDDDLYNCIFDNLLKRLSDKVPAVRVQAVLAMTRLQDPSNKECPVINAYLFHLSNDPNADVRKAILTCIAASSLTLPSILERCRDFKNSVRKAAYTFLSEKVHIKSLTIAQRVQLLHEGLKDRCPMVKKIVEQTLLKNWLKLCDGDIVKLLKCLDVENSSDTASLVLKSYFAYYQLSELASNFNFLSENKVINSEDMTCENALYWLNLCQYLKDSKDPNAEAVLEQLIPEVIPFCEYLQAYILKIPSEEDIEKRLQHDFVCHQLLNLAAVYDFIDIVSRKTMESMIKNMLLSSDINLTLICPLIKRLCDVTNIDERITQMAEIISEIREPLTVVDHKLNEGQVREIELKVAKLSVQLYSCEDEIKEAVKNEDFQKAKELKERISEIQKLKVELNNQKNDCVSQEVRIEKNDAGTIQKCLTIVCEIIEHSKLSSLSSTLHAIMDSLVVPGIQNEDPIVRNLAVRGLGMCCLLNKNVALKHFILFLQISQVDQEVICVTALKAIFDILIVYGLDSFCDPSKSFNESETEDDEIFDSSGEEDEDKGKGSPDTAKHVTSILTALLDSEQSEVSTVAAEGLGKLLLLGRIYSAKLLCRLIILWYNPTTEDNEYLRHFLGVFLPSFAAVSTRNKQCFEEAFIPTLKTLYNAPVSSPLAEVDSVNVARFMLTLAMNNNDPKKSNDENTIHDSLAIKVANEILKDPNAYSVRLLIKVLGYLDISATNSSLLNELYVLTEQMLRSVRDKTCEKPLVKFRDKISDMSEKCEEGHQPDTPMSEDADKTGVTNGLNSTTWSDLHATSASSASLSSQSLSSCSASKLSHSFSSVGHITPQQENHEQYEDFIAPSPEHVPGRKFPKYKKC